MNVSKKQLKEQVANNINMLNVKVKRSFVYVAVNYEHEGMLYHAFDFSKWATEDMRSVQKATRAYQFMLKANCGCNWCRQVTKQLAAFIEKYTWDEQKGISIATGRAVADIVQQIIGDNVADETVRKSNSGFSAPELKSNSGLLEVKYARTKTHPGTMIKNVVSSETG